MRRPPAAPWGHTKHMQKRYRYTEITRTHTHSHTHSYVHATVAVRACYESWLFTHPSILACFAVRLHWSVQTTKQNVYGFVMSRLVFFALSLWSERRDWLCRKLSPSPPTAVKYSGHDRKLQRFQIQPAPPSLFFFFLFSLFFFFFFPSINCQLIDVNSHTSGFLSPPQPVAALICYDLHFYPAASRLANVENCKLNPESPNLRLVSCFSNVHIKGAKKKNAKQGLSNGKK